MPRIRSLARELVTRTGPALVALPAETHPAAAEVLAVAARAHAANLCHQRVDPASPHWDSARIRAAGHDWAAAGWSLDELIHLLGQLTQRVLDLLMAPDFSCDRPLSAVLGPMTDIENRIVRELLEGQRSAEGDRPGDERIATALLSGTPVEPTVAGTLAPAYAVVAFRSRAGEHSTVDVDRLPESGVLRVSCPDGGYLLIPAESRERAFEQARWVKRLLPGRVWVGVSWQRTDRIAEGRKEVVQVLSLAIAARRAPEVYRFEDVLMEFAVSQHPKVAGELVKLIEPVVRDSILHETLTAFVAADGNRNRTAEALDIHRTTLDYRLGKIHRLTGHRPTSCRAVHVLAAGLTAHEAASLGHGPSHSD